MNITLIIGVCVAALLVFMRSPFGAIWNLAHLAAIATTAVMLFRLTMGLQTLGSAAADAGNIACLACLQLTVSRQPCYAPDRIAGFCESLLLGWLMMSYATRHPLNVGIGFLIYLSGLCLMIASHRYLRHGLYRRIPKEEWD